MAYCVTSDLANHLLQAYLDAVKAQNPGLLERLIASASTRIDEALGVRFTVPLDPAPETIKRICAVFAAYEALGAITSLINTEAGSDNEFLPLQREYENCQSVLDKIASGKLQIAGLGQVNSDIHVAAPPRFYNPGTWQKY